MSHEVTFIPGDGTGPELMEATRRVLEATGVGLDRDVHPAGEDVFREEGVPFPDRTPASIKRTRVGINGPTTGSAPKYKGKNRVNPTAVMLTGVLLLRHLSERDAADRLERAIAEVIRRGEKVTYDFKPTRDDPTAVGTSEFADADIAEMSGV